ncbi:MAG: hypothetical protein CMP20_04430 [Rickettsiales bacterium]|nr:hypothetical protein [Rickettsiales bacterium]
MGKYPSKFVWKGEHSFRMEKIVIPDDLPLFFGPYNNWKGKGGIDRKHVREFLNSEKVSDEQRARIDRWSKANDKPLYWIWDKKNDPDRAFTRLAINTHSELIRFMKRYAERLRGPLSGWEEMIIVDAMLRRSDIAWNIAVYALGEVSKDWPFWNGYSGIPDVIFGQIKVCEESSFTHVYDKFMNIHPIEQEDDAPPPHEKVLHRFLSLA